MANCVNDPSLLLSGSMDGKVKLLHIGNKRVLFTFVHSTPKMISSDPNESKMDEEEEPNDYEETSNVECIGFSNGEFRWAASGGLDKTMKIWDLVSGSCRSLCQHQSSVVSLKWHARLPVVATAALDCIIRLWDARAGD
jgi:WD40 repeat protein